MSTTISYPYASGDLLENRNTYFYSQYQGEDFLAAWCAQRNAACDYLSANPDQGSSSQREGTADSPTNRLLEDIWLNLTTNKASSSPCEMLDRLVQRFEVSKRLHGQYGPNWRPLDADDYREPGRYVRFAEVLHLAYSITNKLPYLNALLKCIDTLTALREELEATEKKRLLALIECEQVHVRQLAMKLDCASAAKLCVGLSGAGHAA